MGSKCGKTKSFHDPSRSEGSDVRCCHRASGSSRSRASSVEDLSLTRSEKRRPTSRGQFITHNCADIDSEYDVGDKEGEGTQGIVFRAKRKKTGIMRAVKMVPKKSVSMEKFHREINIMKMLDHPNIIKLFETFDDRNSTYLIMELCRGGELFDKVVEQGSLSEVEAAIVLQQILRSVHYMHENDIAHRDLKPENFLFTSKGPIDEDNLLKLIDFGVACHCGQNDVLKEVVGTPYYVAPQVITGRYDKMSDVWSCGIIMFTLLTGNVPFNGPSDNEVLAKVRQGIVRYNQSAWNSVSEDALALVKKFLTRNPKERFTTAQALEHDWIKNLAPRALPVLQEDIVDRIRVFRRKNQLKQAALSIVANEMDDEQIRHLRETFTSLDTNGDGLLTYAEIRSGVEKDGLEVPLVLDELFNKDAEAVVDYTEFLAATLDIRSHLSDEACRMAFGIFDTDGSGKITTREITKTFGREGSALQRKSSAEGILNKYSTKGDGSMDFNDFREMLQSEFSPLSCHRGDQCNDPPANESSSAKCSTAHENLRSGLQTLVGSGNIRPPMPADACSPPAEVRGSLETELTSELVSNSIAKALNAGYPFQKNDPCVHDRGRADPSNSW